MRYLLDTNICIYIIKRRPESVLNRFSALSVGSIGISSITVFELAYGAGKSANSERSFQALEHFLAPLVIIPFDIENAREAGTIRASLANIGQPIGPYDVQIAGQARRRGLILVTNNAREFERIVGLRIENWVK